jgi:hypothetical protein
MFEDIPRSLSSIILRPKDQKITLRKGFSETLTEQYGDKIPLYVRLGYDASERRIGMEFSTDKKLRNGIRAIRSGAGMLIKCGKFFDHFKLGALDVTTVPVSFDDNVGMWVGTL